MRMELPDINVLIALLDTTHVHHQRAKDWFDTISSAVWVTCPFTQNGFVRVLSNPVNSNANLTAYEAAGRLCIAAKNAGHDHQFWTDSVSFCDETLFDLKQVKGYKQLSDIYLLGLCQAHKATLITFDKAIPTMLPCIVNPHTDLVRVLKEKDM